MEFETENECIIVIQKQKNCSISRQEIVWIISYDLYIRFKKDLETIKEFLEKVIYNETKAVKLLETDYFHGCSGVDNLVNIVKIKLNETIQKKLSETKTTKTKEIPC
ncbi:MAG: hypothetical protein ACP5OG_05955 [Candidatus Nanoarchaeia archaeon]